MNDVFYGNDACWNSGKPPLHPRKSVVDGAFAAIAVAQWFKDNGVAVQSLTVDEFNQPQVLVAYGVHIERLFPDAKRCEPIRAEARNFVRYEHIRLGVTITWTKQEES